MHISDITEIHNLKDLFNSRQKRKHRQIIHAAAKMLDTQITKYSF